MKFQGDIASITIADVVQNLATNQKSGVLTVFRGEETRQIVFRDGQMISYGDNNGFSILQWLDDKCIVDADIFKKARRRYLRSKRKTLGEMLAELGGIDHEEYIRFVRKIVEDMLFETFTFREGTFEFDEGSVDLSGCDREIIGANLVFPVRPVLMEAARRMDDWESIRRSLPSENDIYRIAPADQGSLRKEYAEDATAVTAIELLDGTRSIREVIQAIPSVRFDASRVIAELVSKKLARPVDGDELVEQLDTQTNDDVVNSRALVRLKAALEREPGNRSLLKKVAEISLNEGEKKDSATYYKLLAHELVEDGNLHDAKTELRRSLKLNPNDISAWQKLHDITEKEGDAEHTLSLVFEMAKHYRGMGLNEMARDHLAGALTKHPKVIELHYEYADTLFALGDRAEAVKQLLELARDLFQKRKNQEAETTLAKVIEYDPNHKHAREIYDKVKSGKLEKQRERRRVLVRAIASALVLGLLGLFVGYEYFVRQEFARAARDILTDGLIERGDYDQAIERVREVQEQHPFSLLRYIEAREMLEALSESKRMRDANGAAPPDSDPASEPDSQ